MRREGGGKTGSPATGPADSFLIEDKFPIYQSRRRYTPVINIGEKPLQKRITHIGYANPIRQALWYRELLEKGQAQNQDELAQLLEVSRSRVASTLRLLKLDEEIRNFILSLDDSDERLKKLTERKLRPLLQTTHRKAQVGKFWKMVKSK